MPAFSRLVYACVMWRGTRRARRARASVKANEPPSAETAPHLLTGRLGETLAYWYLRREGYVMVGRNLRLQPGAGELDLVGWDGPVLAFIEVKTRTSLAAGPPEEAVTSHQQKRLARAAAVYVRRLRQKELNYRFDVVSVTWDQAAGFRVKLIRDALRPAAGRRV
ncbi:MAG: YraN family protein [Terriglobia bacterium]